MEETEGGGRAGGRDPGLEQLLTKRRAAWVAGVAVARSPDSRGHAPEYEQNGLGALGPPREARLPTRSRGPHWAFRGRGVRSTVSTPDTWPGPEGEGAEAGRLDGRLRRSPRADPHL